MEIKELKEWKTTHGQELTLGVRVKVKSTCEYYQPEYDKFGIYLVTYLYFDSDGLNIGINDGSKKSLNCDTDGFRINDLKPV